MVSNQVSIYFINHNNNVGFLLGTCQDSGSGISNLQVLHIVLASCYNVKALFVRENMQEMRIRVHPWIRIPLIFLVGGPFVGCALCTPHTMTRAGDLHFIFIHGCRHGKLESQQSQKGYEESRHKLCFPPTPTHHLCLPHHSCSCQCSQNSQSQDYYN